MVVSYCTHLYGYHVTRHRPPWYSQSSLFPSHHRGLFVTIISVTKSDSVTEAHCSSNCDILSAFSSVFKAQSVCFSTQRAKLSVSVTRHDGLHAHSLSYRTYAILGNLCWRTVNAPPDSGFSGTPTWNIHLPIHTPSLCSISASHSHQHS